MPFTIRLLTDGDLAALQEIHKHSSETFRRLIGRPADPGQSARDFSLALQTCGQFQCGVVFNDDLIGVIDCKLDDSEEGLAHIGMLLLTPPCDDPDIRALALRILERWLASACGVSRVETGVVAHAPAEIDFWLTLGYDFTGAQYRRDLPGYAPRFLVLSKTLGS